MPRPKFKCWRRFVDLLDGTHPTTYGLLTVIEFVGFHPQRNCSMWLVECECGTRKVVLGNSLRTGHTTSCGCVGKAKITARNKAGKGVAKGPRNKTT